MHAGGKSRALSGLYTVIASARLDFRTGAEQGEPERRPFRCRAYQTFADPLVGSGNSDPGFPDILTTRSERASVAIGSSRPRCLVRIDGPSRRSRRPRSSTRSTIACARSSSCSNGNRDGARAAPRAPPQELEPHEVAGGATRSRKPRCPKSGRSPEAKTDREAGCSRARFLNRRGKSGQA